VAEPLAPEHRALVLARLAELDRELAEISAWLYGLGEDHAAEWLEDAWKSMAAAGWALERRTKPASG
jgi:hypothetical protein